MRVESAQLQQNFSRAAAQYDQRANLQQRYMRRVLTEALAQWPTHASLLDIGCGTGLFAEEAKTARPEWRITGIDLAYGMCRAAQMRQPVIQADATCLPVATASLDGVVSSLCLQWVADKQVVFKEIARVLKPGGTAIIMTLGDESLSELRAIAEQTNTPIALLPLEVSQTYADMTAITDLQIVHDEAIIEQHTYKNLSHLLHSMRDIGAGRAFAHAASWLTAQQFKILQQAYPKNENGNIIASWQPVMLVLQKAGIA